LHNMVTFGWLLFRYVTVGTGTRRYGKGVMTDSRIESISVADSSWIPYPEHARGLRTSSVKYIKIRYGKRHREFSRVA
jgi:hypothetical protein